VVPNASEPTTFGTPNAHFTKIRYQRTGPRDKSLTKSAVENIRRLLAPFLNPILDFPFMRSEELLNAAH